MQGIVYILISYLIFFLAMVAYNYLLNWCEIQILSSIVILIIRGSVLGECVLVKL